MWLAIAASLRCFFCVCLVKGSSSVFPFLASLPPTSRRRTVGAVDLSATPPFFFPRELLPNRTFFLSFPLFLTHPLYWSWDARRSADNSSGTVLPFPDPLFHRTRVSVSSQRAGHHPFSFPGSCHSLPQILLQFPHDLHALIAAHPDSFLALPPSELVFIRFFVDTTDFDTDCPSLFFYFFRRGRGGAE